MTTKLSLPTISGTALSEYRTRFAKPNLTKAQAAHICYLQKNDSTLYTDDKIRKLLGRGALSHFGRTNRLKGATQELHNRLIQSSTGQKTPPAASSSGAASQAGLGALALKGHTSSSEASSSEASSPKKSTKRKTIREIAISNRIQRSGLYNFGYTCWMNSLIQSLFQSSGKAHLEALQNLSTAALPPEQQIYKERAGELLAIINLMNQKPSVQVNTQLYDRLRQFIANLCDADALLSGIGHQEDSQQGYTSLIQFLGLDHYGLPGIKDISENPRAILSTLLHKGSSVAYTTHRTGKVSHQTSYKQQNLSPVPLAFNSNAKQSVQSLVTASILRREDIGGDNQFSFTGHAQDKEDLTQLEYFSLEDEADPTEVSFQLKRFFWNKRGVAQKIQTPVELDPEIEVPLHSIDGTQVTSLLRLKLDTVICHRGASANSGHYVTYKFGDNQKLTLYNDSRVSQGQRDEQTTKTLEDTAYIVKYRVIEHIKDPTELGKRVAKVPTRSTELALSEGQGGGSKEEPSTSSQTQVVLSKASKNSSKNRFSFKESAYKALTTTAAFLASYALYSIYQGSELVDLFFDSRDS